MERNFMAHGAQSNPTVLNNTMGRENVMKKKFVKLSVLVFVILLALVKTQMVYASESFSTAYGENNVVAEGTCGINLEWLLRDTGKLVISGYGPMYDYSDENKAPWYNYNSQINEIMITSGTTTIDTGAFYACDQVNKVSINSSVMEIGDYAFKDCSSIFYVTLPSSLKKIGSYAFYGTNLASAEIPVNVETIGEGAFANCTQMISITINAPLTKLPEYSFNNCTYLTSVTFPSSLKEIGTAAFDSCTHLSSIAIPAGLTSIGTSAFAGTGLDNIIIPDSVTNIGDSVFALCKNLSSIRLSNNMTSIPQSTFGYCDKLKQIDIPESIANIGTGAFMGCESLTEVEIPETVKSIGSMAFLSCTSLEKICFLNPSVSIGEHVTYGCNILQKVYGYQNSSIENYAQKNNIAFIAWDDAENYTVSLSKKSYVYNGMECRPKVTVTFDENTLTNKDYSVTYFNCINTGEASVQIHGTGRYKILVSQLYRIDPKNIEHISMLLEYSSCNYSGNMRTPNATLKNGSNTLVPGKDYTISYENNLNAGNAKVIARGKGNYEGIQSKTFKINPVKQLINAKSYTKKYGSKSFSLKAKTNGNGKLTYFSSVPSVAAINSSGKVTIKKIGKTTITITASKTLNYKKSSKKITITVIPKSTTLIKAQSKSKEHLTVYWKRNKTVVGYQIYYSTNRKFAKYTKACFIKNSRSTRATIIGLESKKIYYVKIRAYHKVGGKKYYGPFSKIKSDRVL